ncbi:MAG: hypothetical protein ACI4QI_03730 [Candidatus Coproplasma sp.]
MKNLSLKYTQDEILRNEPQINAGDLLAEIIPLLKDYFIGQFTLDGDGITYALLNGQKFTISATEVA